MISKIHLGSRPLQLTAFVIWNHQFCPIYMNLPNNMNQPYNMKHMNMVWSSPEDYTHSLSSTSYYSISACYNSSDPQSYVHEIGHTNHTLALLAQRLQMDIQDWRGGDEEHQHQQCSYLSWRKGQPGSFLNLKKKNLQGRRGKTPWAVHVFTNVWCWSNCSSKNVELCGISYVKAVKHIKD